MELALIVVNFTHLIRSSSIHILKRQIGVLLLTNNLCSDIFGNDLLHQGNVYGILMRSLRSDLVI